jgi:Flp pilus assembly protein TadG
MSDVAGQRDERGATTVFVAVFMAVLLAAVGMSLDMGNAYVVKAKMQTGADNAALAAARDCVVAKSSCTTLAPTTAASLVSANVAGTGTAATVNMASGTVTVTATKTVQFPLMKAVGVRDKVVTTKATASFNNVPVAGYPIFPLALSWCDYQTRTTSLELFRADLGLSSRASQTCRNADNTGDWTAREGALWLVDGDCHYKVSLWTIIRSVVAELVGAPPACRSAIADLEPDQTYVLPLYRAKYTSTDPRVEIVGFVPVKIAGWRFTTLSFFEIAQETADSANCSRGLFGIGVCNGITGTFASTAKKQPEFEYGPGTNLGAASPVLVKE